MKLFERVIRLSSYKEKNILVLYDNIIYGCLLLEVEYVGKLGKIIIFVKVNRDYDFKGWLGNIVGVKCVFEFFGKYFFE